MTPLLGAVSIDGSSDVVVAQLVPAVDGNLRLFIDRVLVPILVQRWLDQHGENESEPAVADAEPFPAAA